jgi:hypothetical protein
MDRNYCTLTELIDDLDDAGVKAWKEKQALDKIKDASDWIDRTLGKFIPVTETRYFDGFGGVDLWAGALLAAITIIDDGRTVQAADYILYPRQRLWESGPYTRITLEPESTSIAAWSNIENIITIAGRWGLYESTVDTGTTVASQDATQTTLTVLDGGAVALGAVLLIDSEQELIGERSTANDSTAELNGALDASAEEVAVDNGTLLHIGEIMKVDFEQMIVRDVSGNTLLVERGWNGTKKVTHTDTTTVYVYRTFTVKRGVNGTTAATHTSADIYRYVPPDTVNYLCRQIATLMLKKAQSGYAGKVGDATLGEVFYQNEFPKSVIKEIKKTFFVPVT